MLKVPKLGDLQIKSTTASFARTLGTLLNAGVSIMDSLKVVASTVSNKVVENPSTRFPSVSPVVNPSQNP